MTALPFDIETPLPGGIIPALRTDHAGETGAVWIYRGILAVSRNVAVRQFAEEHLAVERRHLNWIEQILPPGKRSRLLPVWRVAGWITGALPAAVGERAVFRTIAAVETFVDQHYQEQIDWLDATNAAPMLRQLLHQCQMDEQHHRDDAQERTGAAKPGWISTLWTRMVGGGSAAAVTVARYI